jgi:hypothetical protein
MITRRLAILSGIDPRVADRIGPGLRSRATDVAFVKIGSDGFSQDYFSRLTARALSISVRTLGRQDTKLYALLVSAIPCDDQDTEAEYFFPAARRLEVAREYRRDVNQASNLAQLIQDAFASPVYTDLARRVSPQGEDRLLLPIVNTKLGRMRRHFLEIFRLRSSGLSRRLERDINRMRGGRGYRIVGMDFRGALNDGTHPIRRCTDSPTCDLQALMRFGVAIPERFEFDVSCEKGLEGKTFHLCDGTPVRVSKGVSHLNMRINDDFVPG